MSRVCALCGRPWDGIGQPRFREVCEGCEEDLHSCCNCRFHEPSMPNECRSLTTEPVDDRSRANRCEEFQLASAAEEPKPQGGRGTFDALFVDETHQGGDQ